MKKYIKNNYMKFLISIISILIPIVYISLYSSVIGSYNSLFLDDNFEKAISIVGNVSFYVLLVIVLIIQRVLLKEKVKDLKNLMIIGLSNSKIILYYIKELVSLLIISVFLALLIIFLVKEILMILIFSQYNLSLIISKKILFKSISLVVSSVFFANNIQIFSELSSE